MDTMNNFLCKLLILKGGSSSVAERQLPKLNVAGSIPVSRSMLLQRPVQKRCLTAEKNLPPPLSFLREL